MCMMYIVQGFNRFILIVKQACRCNFDVVLKLLEPSWKWLEMKQKFECSIQMSNYIHTKESSTYVLSFLEKSPKNLDGFYKLLEGVLDVFFMKLFTFFKSATDLHC